MLEHLINSMSFGTPKYQLFFVEKKKTKKKIIATINLDGILCVPVRVSYMLVRTIVKKSHIEL